MKEVNGLSVQEFDVLNALRAGGCSSQRDLAQATGNSLGSINKAYRRLANDGLVDGFSLTAAGRSALKPYKVDNAIIMAAGMSTRFAPLSYEMPKGLLSVRGEVLIERQIRQLQEAGIEDIVVVVGYMKEQFFYLEELFGVKIVVNEEYAVRNNNSTLMAVKDLLGNSFVCSSDNYFTKNVFEPYVYRAYYAASYVSGPTDEYCLTSGVGGRIVAVEVGGSDSYVMLGQAYFDRAFSQEFIRILEAEYDRADTTQKLWEDIYRDHLDSLDMMLRPFPSGVVNEFDLLEELRDFDPAFIENVDSSILDNICRCLKCNRSGIADVYPISRGLTNLSFHFSCNGEEYVYRHPGAGTDKIINRAAEAFSQAIAAELGLDNTYVYEHPEEGWKVSRYIEGCSELDYHDADQVSRAMEMARTLHRCGKVSQWEFDLHEKTKEIIRLMQSGNRAGFRDFDDLFQLIDGLDKRVKAEGVPHCLCHNDFYGPNFLVEPNGAMHLIDWEYSGMSDYASDLGTFICCSDYDYDESLVALREYFGCEPSAVELAHCVAYIAISSYYWFIWALYKDACGSPVGEWLYLWYRNAKRYGQKAHSLYAELDG